MADRGNRLLRFVDFWLGIPLVWLAGLFRLRHRPLPARKDIRRIGILATAAIGDSILMSAVLKDIKEACPDAEITLFVGASNHGIAEMVCPQDLLVRLRVSNPLNSARVIRSKGVFDLWVDFGPWPRLNALLSILARSRHTVGFRTPGQARHYAYDATATHRDNRHEMENLRALAGAVGIESLRVPAISPAWADVEHNGSVVVHMIPGGYLSHYKEWSTENWKVLMDGLTAAGKRLVLTGAPLDRPKNQAVRLLCEKRDSIEDRAGEVSLRELPELLSHSSLVISVNTGIMHMAAAVGCPLIALHGPTSPERWGPVSDCAVNFTATSPSAGCLNLGFEYDRQDPNSLDTINPEAVLTTALEILEN